MTRQPRSHVRILIIIERGLLTFSRYPASLHALKDRWEKAMSRAFSEGKQALKFVNSRNCGRVCLFQATGNEELFCLKDDSGKLWVEVIIVTFLDAVATIDVITASNNDVKLGESRTVYLA